MPLALRDPGVTLPLKGGLGDDDLMGSAIVFG